MFPPVALRWATDSRALSDELPFHFSQASKQSDEEGANFPSPLVFDESVGGSDADASFLEVIVSIKVAR